MFWENDLKSITEMLCLTKEEVAALKHGSVLEIAFDEEGNCKIYRVD